MGPAILRGGEAMDVRPHPHIGLSTVTYLFDGAIRHRDSLGTEMVIKPGDVNLMTAGRGIVHSERSPEEMRGGEMPMSGLQTWLALPDHLEEIDPAFSHIATSELPEISDAGIRARVVMGGFGGQAEWRSGGSIVRRCAPENDRRRLGHRRRASGRRARGWSN
jgi:redox-sensitive bicupin YhaK (pirin superfamily)